MSFKKEYNKITDFVIPLHRYHYMLRTLIESINLFYSPKTIYIITPKCNCDIIEKNKFNWGKNDNNNIVVIEEEIFFENFMKFNDINELFTKNIDERNREFGWWYQQLIKLGSFKQIPNLSDPYIVWDSDLIPLIKWDIYPNEENNYFKFAILQEYSRNNWLYDEYNNSMLSLSDLSCIDPEVGTFVPHHYVFYHHILRDLIKHIEEKTNMNWIESIIKLSNNYFRFSEYRIVSSFMNKYYPELLNYYSFDKFGKFGKRIRDSIVFLLELENYLFLRKIDYNYGISYSDFVCFVKEKYGICPSYLQIEHI